MDYERWIIFILPYLWYLFTLELISRFWSLYEIFMTWIVYYQIYIYIIIRFILEQDVKKKIQDSNRSSNDIIL